MFSKFNEKLQLSFTKLSHNLLFTTDVDKDLLWNTYLDSFPNDTNPIYRTNREYDCNCCKSFIRSYGNVVGIKDNKLVSVWDIDPPYPFDVVSGKLKKLVEQSNIVNRFLTRESKLGSGTSFKQYGESIETFEHFCVTTPTNCTTINELGPILSATRTNYELIHRLMEEITLDSANTVIEIIDQGSLYRGEEFKKSLKDFVLSKTEYDKLKENKDNWCWNNISNPIARLRNTAIGTLLIDISKGEGVDSAVRKFETIMAPSNYKRPKAIFTQKMVKDAETTVNKLGLTTALGRRYANYNDININNVLFVNRDVRPNIKGSVFDELSVSQSKKFDKVEEIHIEDFINKVLPTAKNLEILLENNHRPNLVSLIGPEHPSKPLFKWDNNFSWAYNGDMTDSMKERVKAAGGKVDGVLRFSIQWNDQGKTISDYDAHCYEPAGHIYFGQKLLHTTRGNLDVDIISPNGVAVENITWPSIHHMKEGTYKFKVHCYSKRSGHGGFSAELEYDGQIHSFVYDKDLKEREFINVAKIQFSKKDGINFIESLDWTTSIQETWGIKTNTFNKVSMLMYSPNFWDGKQIGNKHYFFIIDKCKNGGEPRGFFNEFLRNDLEPHKRVFEALGSKMRVQQSDEQLSGVGFSSTQNNSVVVKVEGNITRTLKILF